MVVTRTCLCVGTVGVWVSNTTYKATRGAGEATPFSTTDRQLTVKCKSGNGITRAPLGSSQECNPERSVPLDGDFGASPEFVSAVASPGGVADGVLSVGDNITLTWNSPTNMAMADSGCPTTPSSEVPLTGDRLYNLVKLQLLSGTDIPGMSYTGAWTNCSTLVLTVTTSPTGPTLIDAGVNANVLGAGGQSGVGVRDPLGFSQAIPGVQRVTGSFGHLSGPGVISAVARDSDNTDARFSDGDTLTVTFTEPTNSPAGLSLNKQAVDSLLSMPSAGSNYTGLWQNTSIFVMTVLDARCEAAGPNPPCTSHPVYRAAVWPLSSSTSSRAAGGTVSRNRPASPSPAPRPRRLLTRRGRLRAAAAPISTLGISPRRQASLSKRRLGSSTPRRPRWPPTGR